MSILQKIQSAPMVRTIEVEVNGEVYRLTGCTSSALLGRTVLAPDDALKTRVLHYSNLGLDDLDLPTVRQVLLVTELLEHEADPGQRYDETEIAKLALVDGPLMWRLYGAACELLGLTGDPQGSIAEAASGN